jgi:cell division protein FtsN
MAKDYKYRAQGKTGGNSSTGANPLQSVSFWKWMLATTLAIFFVVFLVYVTTKGSNRDDKEQFVAKQAVISPQKSDINGNKGDKQPFNNQAKPEHKLPQFDFYTILPEKEVIVSEYEINTRIREERINKVKEKNYIMQAGSFKAFKEADVFRAKLGLLGIESKVHKAKVGNVIWYRVKIGPYAHMASIRDIKSRLRQNGIDVIVTETTE